MQLGLTLADVGALSARVAPAGGRARRLGQLGLVALLGPSVCSGSDSAARSRASVRRVKDPKGKPLTLGDLDADERDLMLAVSHLADHHNAATLAAALHARLRRNGKVELVDASRAAMKGNLRERPSRTADRLAAVHGARVLVVTLHSRLVADRKRPVAEAFLAAIRPTASRQEP